MDIVCVSHNAPPMNDAEALCTIRLLSALADCGANVHLIAAAVPATLDASIAAELTDSRIKTTFVPAQTGRAAKLSAAVRFQFHSQRLEWIAPAIRETKKVLRQCKNPVLLTRAFPLASNLVGYHCRPQAKAWVAHFSDPYPPFEWQNHWYSRFLRPIHRRWARRILSAADLVTVTCPNATRFIEEKSGFAFREKAQVVSHLALPKLRPGNFKLDRRPEEFVIAHIGAMMARRRPDLLLQGALLAMERHPEIRFLQYGHVDYEVLQLCRHSPAFQRLDLRHVGNLSPRDAADLQTQVDVNVVADTDLGLPYSPFILSKYPHSVCAGRPLLVLGPPDGEMPRLALKYGAGETAPFSTPAAVADAIGRLFARRHENLDASKMENHQREFSAEQIVKPFYEKLVELSR